MLGSQLKSGFYLRHFSSNVLDITSGSNLKSFVAGLGYKSYSNKSGCCKDDEQTKGRKVEVWPKADPPPPAWRCECPADPQPSNYDPYRIKGPEIVVPPLKGAVAKWTGPWAGVAWTTTGPGGEREPPLSNQQGYGPYPGPGGCGPGCGPGYGQQQGGEEESEGKEGGLLGMLKSLFGKGKKKSDSDQMSPATDIHLLHVRRPEP